MSAIMVHQALAVVALLLATASATKLIAEDPWPRRFVWMGDTTDDSFQINLDVEPGDEELIVTTSKTNLAYKKGRYPNLQTMYTDMLDTKIYKKLRRVTVENLQEKTQYYVFIARGADAKKHPNVTFPIASIRTFPAKSKSADVTVALGSCQGRPEDARSLHEIAMWSDHLGETQKNTTFFMLHMGDLHYSNIARNDPTLFRDATEDVVTDSVGRRLFRSTHVSYGWDDHDYGANNADASSLSRPAALLNYRSMVPYYKPGGFDTMYHSFNVAKFLFIVTDLRSESDGKLQQAMSPTQENWMFLQLKEWMKWDAVIWLSSRPWIAGAEEGSDTWGGFARQRHRIANEIARLKINNLIVVSGDAHMLAADDGTHSYYADEKLGHRGFPVLQAAPLAKYGSTKGGPYTEGCFGFRLVKNYQYAILTLKPTASIKKTGTHEVTMEFKGYHATRAKGSALEKKKPLLTYSMGTPFLATNVVKGGGNGSCSISLAPWWYYVVVLVVLVAVVLGINFYVAKRRARKKQDMMNTDDVPSEPLAPM